MSDLNSLAKEFGDMEGARPLVHAREIEAARENARRILTATLTNCARRQAENILRLIPADLRDVSTDYLVTILTAAVEDYEGSVRDGTARRFHASLRAVEPA